jgi:hypothetical protein
MERENFVLSSRVFRPLTKKNFNTF